MHALVVLCRSVTMDAWSAEQLKRMQLGGNDALNVFLKKYGVDKYIDIKEKYNSPGAEVRHRTGLHMDLHLTQLQ